MPTPNAKPVYRVRVVADGLEDGRVHHAAAEHFDPAGVLAERAARSAARRHETSSSADGSV